MDNVMGIETRRGNKPKMKRKAYEQELRKLQIELCHLQDWVKAKGARIIVVARWISNHTDAGMTTPERST
jgi:polyphosphate kinase 2 (PPK2 family)